MKKLIFVSLCLCFIGCTTSMTMYRDPFPVKDDNAEIDIYHSQPPTTNYVEIAEIKVDAIGSASKNIPLLKREARKIGADAIIIMGPAGYISTGTGAINTSEHGLKAIAIKYKDQN